MSCTITPCTRTRTHTPTPTPCLSILLQLIKMTYCQHSFTGIIYCILMGLLRAERLIWDSHPTQKSTILLSFPAARVPLGGERIVIPRACLFIYFAKEIEIAKGVFHSSVRVILWRRVLRCLIELTMLPCLQLSDLFPSRTGFPRPRWDALEQPYRCLHGDNVKNARPRTSMTARR